MLAVRPPVQPSRVIGILPFASPPKPRPPPRLAVFATIASSGRKPRRREQAAVIRTHRRPPLPLAPLLRAYAEAGPPETQGPRVAAVRAAAAEWFRDELLDALSADDFRAGLVRFY